MRVMIVVTHLLGTGHLSRALTLAHAFGDSGHQVTVVSGGRRVPHLDITGVNFVQLPSLASDGTNFSRLLTADGVPADTTFMTDRQSALVEAFRSVDPHVLITELFPFGRRNLRNEIIALLNATPNTCRVFASVRDILAPPSSPQKVEFAEDVITEFYDGVLLHADPNVITLNKSWPVTDKLAGKLHYTGFVAPAPRPMTVQRDGPVVVSVGGGTVGAEIFEAALDAARKLTELKWLFVVGDDALRQDLDARAPQNVVVEGLRQDFRELLTTARASVSMCGYNTALDVLQSGVPAVLVPFDDGGEVEQTLRANALKHLPAIHVITKNDLRPATLGQALTDVLQETRAPQTDGMDGAKTSVHLVTELTGAERVSG
ncbi:MAG: glycosyltransferase [Pseudomonadota bacterium]